MLNVVCHPVDDCSRGLLDSGIHDLAILIMKTAQHVVRNVPPFGRLTDAKEWFVSTPTAVLLTDAAVKAAWEAQCPDLDQVVPLSLSANTGKPALARRPRKRLDIVEPR